MYFCGRQVLEIICVLKTFNVVRMYIEIFSVARPFGLGVDRATPQCSLPSLLGPERLGNPHKGVCVRQPDWRRFFFF